MHKYQCDMPVTGQKVIANDQKTQVQINHFLMGHKKAVSKWFKKTVEPLFKDPFENQIRVGC